MSATIVGVNVVWGVQSGSQAGTGYTTTSASIEPQSEIKELADEDNDVKSVVIHRKSDMLTLEVYPSGDTPGSLPAIGSTVTVNSVKYMAMPGCKTNETQDGEQTMTFVLKKWPDITLT